MVRDMFGDLAACKPWTILPGEDCQLKDKVELWRHYANSMLEGGRCFGIASTSEYLYSNPDKLASLFNTDRLISLPLDLLLRQYTARYHSTQWANPYHQNFGNYSNSTPGHTLYLLSEMLMNKENDQGILFLIYLDHFPYS